MLWLPVLNTRMIFADDAVFRVVRGTSYTIPMPAASDANNDVLEVSVSGLDKYGNALVIRDGCFTPYNTGGMHPDLPRERPVGRQDRRGGKGRRSVGHHCAGRR